MKHAILVLAHGDLTVLKYQMRILDDSRFDFFIHIDKKSNNSGEELQNICKHSNVFITQQIAVYWGHSSINDATMLLIHELINSGYSYDYVHLLSGADLPIKRPDEIDRFFENNSGKEYVVIWKVANWRTNYRYPLVKLYRRTGNEKLNKIKKFLISRIVRLPRRKNTSLRKDKEWDTYCGDQWWSYTWKFVNYINNIGDAILPYFKDCYLTDECFTQTILMNSIKFSQEHSNVKTREIRWDNYSPHVWKSTEIEDLLKSDALFARKFDYTEIDAVKEIAQRLLD